MNQATAKNGTRPEPSARVETLTSSSTLNVFADSPEGYSCHVQVVFPQELAKVVVKLTVLTKALHQAGCKPRASSATTLGPQPVAIIQEGIACGKCQGATVWDNRTSKRSKRSPDFRCRDCGAVAWASKDGLRWSDPL